MRQLPSCALSEYAVFLLTAGFIVTKTARDALYIQHDGLHAVLLAVIFIVVLSIVVRNNPIRASCCYLFQPVLL